MIIRLHKIQVRTHWLNAVSTSATPAALLRFALRVFAPGRLQDDPVPAEVAFGLGHWLLGLRRLGGAALQYALALTLPLLGIVRGQRVAGLRAKSTW